MEIFSAVAAPSHLADTPPMPICPLSLPLDSVPVKLISALPLFETIATFSPSTDTEASPTKTVSSLPDNAVPIDSLALKIQPPERLPGEGGANFFMVWINWSRNSSEFESVPEVNRYTNTSCPTVRLAATAGSLAKNRLSNTLRSRFRSSISLAVNQRITSAVVWCEYKMSDESRLAPAICDTPNSAPSRMITASPWSLLACVAATSKKSSFQ